MRVQTGLLVVSMVTLAIAGPALAGQGERVLRFGLQNSSPTGDLLVLGATVEAEQAVGPVISLEFMVNEILGIEPSLRFTNHDVEGNGQKLGDFDMIPLIVNANFHVLRREKVDLYVGPQIGYVLYQDLQVAGSSDEAPLKDGFTLGALFGVDVPIKKGGWLFNASLSWISTDAELKDPGTISEIAIDPIVLRVGAGKRFGK